VCKLLKIYFPYLAIIQAYLTSGTIAYHYSDKLQIVLDEEEESPLASKFG